MYHLDIITRIPEPEPDGIIRIRPGESTIVRIDESDSVPQIHGRPAEWSDKKIPALVIALSDDTDEIFRLYYAPEDPEDAVPFLAISSDLNRLLSCRAEGKVLFCKTADRSSGSAEAMQYLHEIIRKTEYCIFLCSRRDPAWIHLAGQIAQYARAQNTLAVLAVIGEGKPDSNENMSDILEKFHTIILTLKNSNSLSTASLEQTRDLCEATIDDIVASGGKHAFLPSDRLIVRDLLFKGGISYLMWHSAGDADVHELIKGYVGSVQGNDPIMTGGTYSILKAPWQSTVDAATELRNSLLDILVEKVPSRYPHQMRVEGYYPEVEGQFDLSTWTFTGNYKFP